MTTTTDEPKRIVLLDEPTENLLRYRAEWEEQLTWGLSKQARKAIEIKVGAVNYVLRERNEE